MNDTDPPMWITFDLFNENTLCWEVVDREPISEIADQAELDLTGTGVRNVAFDLGTVTGTLARLTLRDYESDEIIVTSPAVIVP